MVLAQRPDDDWLEIAGGVSTRSETGDAVDFHDRIAEIGSSVIRSADIVIDAEISMIMSPAQPTAYRIRESALLSAAREPATSSAIRAPCQRKWMCVQASAFVIFISSSPRIRPAAGGSA